MANSKDQYKLKQKALAMYLMFCCSVFSQADKPLEIIVDADYSGHLESSLSIERGISTALSRFKLKRKVIIKRADHRGNSKRSKRNISNFLKSENALLLMSGIHSPPLLAHKDYINNNKALYLVPWAAAGPITRSNSNQNWIFRLSIDDSKAGAFLSNYAAEKLETKSPCLLLENTGWGKSNFKEMTKGFQRNNIEVKKTIWFKWGIKELDASGLARSVAKSGCDIVLLVANSNEGSHIVNAISKLNKNIDILSHWGITGGKFHKLVDSKARNKVNLKFIQTKFNFISSKESAYSKKVLKDVMNLFKEVKSKKDIRASTGFVHAYDLGVILGNVLSDVDLSQDIKIIREEVKSKLETLSKPVKGLLKTYIKPFSKYSKNKVDAHEALDSSDFAIGKYQDDGSIVNE